MKKPGRLAQAVFLMECCLFTQTAIAVRNEGETDGSRTGFVYGGDCNQLAQLRLPEIKAVTHTVHAENFDRFCYVHGIYSCSDYNAMLRGAGALEENESFGCTYVPRTN